MIDCCIHNTWSSAAELVDYLPEGWREYVAGNVAADWSDFLRGVRERPGTPLRFAPMTPVTAYPRPGGDKLAEFYPTNGGLPGSDLATLRTGFLDRYGIERALLCSDFGLLIASITQPRLSVEIARAANEWMTEQWLDSGDERLYGTVVTPSQVPELAAAEIRRAGAHPRMMGIVMATSPFGKPLGHPVYGPIYEAAAELGLVVVLHAGGSGMSETMAAVAAAGPPASYTDYYTLLPQALMSHITSLIAHGNFERYPGLRVLVVGAGAAWLPPFLWRFDTEYQGMRIEAPWLTQRPSDQFRQFFRVGTNPLDPAPTDAQRLKYYGAFRGLEDILCYASGYPNWDTNTPADLSAALPDDWYSKVTRENSLAFFRWDARPSPTLQTPTVA